ncbi:hypothetical protein BDV96DRAFT_642858 [Lophiotrema nucula]|uniref:Peptidase M43 pregnancy-associated plasma-A domain-containing protein n=1 Tax=Lophiotrema nucula TaxID=690887 RepID=A0A6A5ZIK7_9PLEO|nr:hypothetical protein BDV96DRAFT_642858 [Lophiotrema nucula]
MIRPQFLALLGLLAPALAAAQSPPPFDCGTNTQHASEDFLKSIQALHKGSNSGSPAARAATLAARDGQINVDAVFHIVSKDDKKGDITNDMPNDQLQALNDAYKDYGIQFNLINVTWNTNNDWAVGEDGPDTDMKKQLRQGTYKTLNIYFQTDLTGGVLGRCTLPSDVANGKTDHTVYWNDGCNVNANTMPGGLMDGFNKGGTAVHEAGHWMGLLHTFEGYKCDGDGDFIDDTPMESQSTDGCPDSPVKSSCSGNGGDPIHNYMDYSTDACYTGFTPKQKDRMHTLYAQYRDGN